MFPLKKSTSRNSQMAISIHFLGISNLWYRTKSKTGRTHDTSENSMNSGCAAARRSSRRSVWYFGNSARARLWVTKEPPITYSGRSPASIWYNTHTVQVAASISLQPPSPQDWVCTPRLPSITNVATRNGSERYLGRIENWCRGDSEVGSVVLNLACLSIGLINFIPHCWVNHRSARNLVCGLGSQYLFLRLEFGISNYLQIVNNFVSTYFHL